LRHEDCARLKPALRREIHIYFKEFVKCVKPAAPDTQQKHKIQRDRSFNNQTFRKSHYSKLGKAAYAKTANHTTFIGQCAPSMANSRISNWADRTTQRWGTPRLTRRIIESWLIST
ncbi:MAG TPA: hypothetical protein VFB79_17545, partial [Candidatus Angelobacter sp.]|nr:hypothetical protein [Candidatus Angelobacter sp.]